MSIKKIKLTKGQIIKLAESFKHARYSILQRDAKSALSFQIGIDAAAYAMAMQLEKLVYGFDTSQFLRIAEYEGMRAYLPKNLY